jgi:adenine-specific DNA-methyltransferase
MRYASSINRAKRNRAEMTEAEDKLWRILRSRRYAQVKFRRQHAIGPFVVDFACVGARLVIEVDGASHARDEQIAFDQQRTSFLEQAGWRVMRISNEEVFAARDGLYNFLDACLRDAS